MNELTEELIQAQEEAYAVFSHKLVPTLPRESFIGVRVPKIREIEKRYRGTEEAEAFLGEFPHRYHEENMLHSVLVSHMKGFYAAAAAVDRFLPYVDNWAVCDTLRPDAFKKEHETLLPLVYGWMESPKTYTCRFGLEMLMTHYLGADFEEEQLLRAAQIESQEYYVNMMLAWYFATALAFQWDAAVKLLEERRLSPWVHNKTIQKACESFRVLEERKGYLKTIKR